MARLIFERAAPGGSIEGKGKPSTRVHRFHVPQVPGTLKESSVR